MCAPEEIEKEIDQLHTTNPIFGLSFEKAAWHLLMVLEDRLFDSSMRDRKLHNAIAEADNYVNALRPPFEWISERCKKTGEVPVGRVTQNYQDASELLKLAVKYNHCTTIFPLLRKKRLTIEVGEESFSCKRVDEIDFRYEAYNRLAPVELANSPQFDSPTSQFEKLASILVIRNDDFQIKWKHGILREFTEIINKVMDGAYKLDKHSQFSHFTLKEFRSVFSVLSAICFCWIKTREQMALNGSNQHSQNSPLLVFETERLIALVNRTAGLKNKALVRSIIRYLTYGGLADQGLRVLDPALQPLIPIAANQVAIAPYWFSSLSPERNIYVLLNLIDAEKEFCNTLKSKKESKMQNKLEAVTASKEWKTKKGHMVSRKQNMELDFAIVDPDSRTVLLMELKWFVAPAEIRETLHRHEDLKKGIEQCKKRVEFLESDSLAKEWMAVDLSLIHI